MTEILDLSAVFPANARLNQRARFARCKIVIFLESLAPVVGVIYTHEMVKQKAFTVEEANAMIPILDAVLDALEEKSLSLRSVQQKLQLLDAMWGDAVTATGNPDHGEYRQYRDSASRLVREFREIVRSEIQGRGLRFPPGGVEHGLVDFPSTFKGRWIYLCWQRGESQVSHWHEINAGFSSRQEIDTEHIVSMGKLDDPDLLDDSILDY